ncbi:hypothetical protein HK405_004399, partial [Cladochytrium tenue]
MTANHAAELPRAVFSKPVAAAAWCPVAATSVAPTAHRPPHHHGQQRLLAVLLDSGDLAVVRAPSGQTVWAFAPASGVARFAWSPA